MDLSSLIPDLGSVLCTAIASLFTYFAAVRKARNEFRQWKAEFEHQQQRDEDARFEEMVRLCYQQFDTRVVDSRAVSLISLSRSGASGPYAEALDELYDVIALDQSVRIPGAIERVTAARKAAELV